MTVKDGGRSVKEPALLPGHPTQLFPHGIYADQRQETGYCWYCPMQDWRSPAHRPGGEQNLILYCQSCGVVVSPSVNEDLRPGGAP